MSIVLSRPNWSRPLPRPLVIPKVMTLTTIADVRELIKHLPKEIIGQNRVVSQFEFSAC